MTRLEYRWGRSSKFYEISCSGCELICNYGKIGGKVRTIRRRCSSDLYAWRAGQRKIVEKVSKGYQIVCGAPCEVPQLMSGFKWRGDVDLSGWLISEKFDGCRAYWDGERLWTRGGIVIQAPGWFLEGLPPRPLDCELWAGYGLLDVAHSAIKGNSAAWRRCRLKIFDAPGDQPFGERIKTLVGAPHADVVRYLKVTSNAAALTILGGVTAVGGEGLVARDPGAPYLPGRHPSIQKIKRRYLPGAA